MGQVFHDVFDLVAHIDGAGNSIVQVHHGAWEASDVHVTGLGAVTERTVVASSVAWIVEDLLLRFIADIHGASDAIRQ